MKKQHLLIISVVVLTTFVILVFRSCRYDWNPHYIDNNAVTIERKQLSPNNSIAVVYYTLDVGARGTRLYKSLLREKDYKKNLFDFNLPPELVIEKWLNNKTLFVKYDPNEIYRLGATYSELDMLRDTIRVNGIDLIITERIEIKKR